MATQYRSQGRLERTVYRSRWQDGLLDLLGGLAVLGLGWSWRTGSLWMGILSGPLLVPAWKFLRVTVVERRIGWARFPRGWCQRKSDGTRGAAAFGLGIVTFFLAHHVLATRLGHLTAPPSLGWTESTLTALPVLLALTVAMVLGLRRFLAYSVVLLGAGSLGNRAGLDPATHLLLAGAVIVSMGFFLFAHFLLAHPSPLDTPEFE